MQHSLSVGPKAHTGKNLGTSPTISPKKLHVSSEVENKNSFICRFCGGKSCKHEDWTKCKNPAIQGLHSNWINEQIIASQRLSNRLIKEFDIIKQLKEKNVGAIINLQEMGEHPHCGDGIIKNVGYSYEDDQLHKCRLALTY